ETYTADVTPIADGVVTVDVAAAVAENAFGNDNSAAVQFAITFDATAPTVSISSTAVNPTRTSPIPVTVTFSEEVSGFVAGDIVVTNGVVDSFAAGDDVGEYLVGITPLTDG